MAIRIRVCGHVHIRMRRAHVDMHSRSRRKSYPNVQSLSVSALARELGPLADAHGLALRCDFVDAMARIRSAMHGGRGGGAPDAENAAASRWLSHAVFSAFAAGGARGEVAYVDELLAGLTVLCGGGQAEKFEAGFRVFDFDGDGALTEAELAAFLSATFRVTFIASPGQAAAAGVGPGALAAATAAAAFAALGAAASRGRITLPEFLAWYAADAAPAAAPAATAPAARAFNSLDALQVRPRKVICIRVC